MKVVGIDPSLTGTGLAVNDGSTIARFGREGITKLRHEAKPRALRALTDEIMSWITGHAPHLAVIETPAYSRAGGGAVERHWLYLHIVGECWRLGIPVAEVGPSQRIRYALGKGAGRGKGAVIDAVARRWPGYETRGDDNLADAVVLAAMGADHLGVPITAMSAPHRAALDGIFWPQTLGAQQ